MKELDFLNSSARFLTTFGYLGVALALGLCAWYFHRKRFLRAFWITGTVALTFLVIFGALDIIAKHFPDVIVVRPPLLIGQVGKVPQDTRVALQGGDVLNTRPFMRRENDADDIAIANHRFIFPRRMFDCFMLAVTRPEVREPNIFSVPIPAVLQAERDDELYVRVHLGPDGTPKPTVVWIRSQTQIGEQQTAREMKGEEVGCAMQPAPTARSNNTFYLFGRAHAQGVSAKPLSPDAVEKLLQSDDAFVRRKTRQDLGALGLQAEPTLQRLLDSKSYRSQIGAVEAINAMKPEARSQLSGHVWKDVEALTASPDPSLRQSAERALSKRRAQ
jgi:hypothetical protein